MKRRAKLIALSMVFLGGCSSAPKRVGPLLHREMDVQGDYYKDHYDPAAEHYENDDMGFSLDFDDGWTIYPHFYNFQGPVREIATSIRSQGGELLLFGMAKSNMYGFRASVEELNIPPMEYFQIIRRINGKEIAHDDFKIVSLNGTDAIRWDMWMTKNGMDFHYREYQIKKGSYNIRFTFWTLDRLFDLYGSKFDMVANTLKIL